MNLSPGDLKFNSMSHNNGLTAPSPKEKTSELPKNFLFALTAEELRNSRLLQILLHNLSHWFFTSKNTTSQPKERCCHHLVESFTTVFLLFAILRNSFPCIKLAGRHICKIYIGKLSFEFSINHLDSYHQKYHERRRGVEIYVQGEPGRGR